MTINASYVALFVAFLSMLFSFAGARFGVRNKQLDAIIQDQKRFDDLYAARVKILMSISESKKVPFDEQKFDQIDLEARIFFDRFWGLQFDTFLAWHEGYIPTKIYSFWLISRRRQLRKSSADWTLNGRTLASTFAGLNEHWCIPNNLGSEDEYVVKFVEIMNRLKNDDELNIKKILSKYGPHPVIRLMRKIFGGY